MATIIGGIGTSHTPTIGIAFDQGKQQHPAWAPLFKGYQPIVEWLARMRPDVLVMFYNDHANSFFFDHYPTFAVGLSERHTVADEGLGLRPVPPVNGHPALARHIAESLVTDEFDISVFTDLPIDHGCFSPLSVMWPEHATSWPGVIVPIEMNVLQHPMPTPRRCYKLGQAVRRAIESYPEDLNVVVVGTGGLSHQLSGERAGYNDSDWDLRFLDLLAKDPEVLANMTHGDFIELGGSEGAEVIMWLAMRGALSSNVAKLHQNYYLAMTAAWAVQLYEEPVAATRRPAATTKARAGV